MAKQIGYKDLNFKCRIENPTFKEQDEAGGTVDEYGLYVACPCYYETKNAYRSENEGYEKLVTETRVYIPWRLEFEANITKDSRVTIDRIGNSLGAVDSIRRYQDKNLLLEIRVINAD
jgi:hypothetical protein